MTAMKNTLRWQLQNEEVRIVLPGPIEVCYPLYSLLLATHQTRVDFLSLDIEGAELAVLRTVPWDKVS